MKIRANAIISTLLFYTTFCISLNVLAQFDEYGEYTKSAIKENKIKEIKIYQWDVKQWRLSSIKMYDTNGINYKVQEYSNEGKESNTSIFSYDEKARLIDTEINLDNKQLIKYKKIYQQVDDEVICSEYYFNSKLDSFILASAETYNNKGLLIKEIRFNMACLINIVGGVSTATTTKFYNNDNQLIRSETVDSCHGKSVSKYKYHKSGKLKSIDLASQSYQSFTKFDYSKKKIIEEQVSFIEKQDRTINKYMTTLYPNGLRHEICRFIDGKRWSCMMKYSYEFY